LFFFLHLQEICVFLAVFLYFSIFFCPFFVSAAAEICIYLVFNVLLFRFRSVFGSSAVHRGGGCGLPFSFFWGLFSGLFLLFFLCFWGCFLLWFFAAAFAFFFALGLGFVLGGTPPVFPRRKNEK
jgi:hypothetical protein